MSLFNTWHQQNTKMSNNTEEKSTTATAAANTASAVAGNARNL